MTLGYQVATPEVAFNPNMTCYQGDLETSIRELASFGYQSVEFMTVDPDQLDWDYIASLLHKYHMTAVCVCTGELGGLGWTVSASDPVKREESLRRISRLIDFASFLGTHINAGRIKGDYSNEVPHEITKQLAVEGFRYLCDYARDKNVGICLETAAFVYMSFVNTCAEAYEIIKKVDRENFHLMMDIFHLYVEEKDMFESMRQYSSVNRHIHLADNNRMYPGASGLDFRHIIQTFHDCGYRGAFVVESRQYPDQQTAACLAAKHLLPILRDVYKEDL